MEKRVSSTTKPAICDIDQALSLLSTNELLLLANPLHPKALYGVRVHLVKHGAGFSFVLCQSYAGGQEPISPGHEAATCLQVIRAYSKTLDNSEISDIHFYCHYDGEWRHVAFQEFDPEKITRSWPDCDSGEALGPPNVQVLDHFKDLVNSPLTCDFTGSPIAYWYQRQRALSNLYERYADALERHKAARETEVPFGDISYSVKEVRALSGVYHRDKKLLKMRLEALRCDYEIVFETPATRYGRNKGWAAIAVCVLDNADCATKLEPGIHDDPDGQLNWLRSLLTQMGHETTDSQRGWKVELSGEAKLLNRGNTVVMRRGIHHFLWYENSKEDLSINDIPF